MVELLIFCIIIGCTIVRCLRNYGFPKKWKKIQQMKPCFCSYQLIGDSLLLRFAEQLLRETAQYSSGLRFLGLCVSGQTMKQLKKRITEGFYPVSSNAVLLIGTNDFLQKTPLKDMMRRMKKIADLLKTRAKRVVVLTVPPVPRLSHKPEHWKKLEIFNKFIISLPNSYVFVTVADISPLFIRDNEFCKLQFFEKYFSIGRRKDMIHLNREGLEELKKFLVDKNFV